MSLSPEEDFFENLFQTPTTSSSITCSSSSGQHNSISNLSGEQPSSTFITTTIKHEPSSDFAELSNAPVNPVSGSAARQSSSKPAGRSKHHNLKAYNDMICSVTKIFCFLSQNLPFSNQLIERSKIRQRLKHVQQLLDTITRDTDSIPDTEMTILTDNFIQVSDQVPPYMLQTLLSSSLRSNNLLSPSARKRRARTLD
jgi:hypothetical protein